MPTDLEARQLDEFASEHPAWERESDSITRTFVFKDFSQAIGFVVRVALAAEVADHHPDIDIRWNKVTVVLSTHSEAALTSKDLDLARQFDSFA